MGIHVNRCTCAHMHEDQVDISTLHLIFGDSLSRNLELGTSAKAGKFERPVYLPDSQCWGYRYYVYESAEALDSVSHACAAQPTFQA